MLEVLNAGLVPASPDALPGVEDDGELSLPLLNGDGLAVGAVAPAVAVPGAVRAHGAEAIGPRKLNVRGLNGEFPHPRRYGCLSCFFFFFFLGAQVSGVIINLNKIR